MNTLNKPQFESLAMPGLSGESREFQFRKLEIKPKLSISEENLALKNIVESKTTPVSSSPKTWKIVTGSMSLVTLGLAIGYLIFNKPQIAVKAVEPPIKLAQPISVAPARTIKTKPTNINFFDSIVFLNDVKGEKKVVSKGLDDYLKKEKLVIKVGENYYNCFCNDLIKNYKVGDIIP